MILLCIVHLAQEAVPLLLLEFRVRPIVLFGNHRNRITPVVSLYSINMT